MKLAARSALALLAGAALSATVPPAGMPWLILPALALFFATLRGLRPSRAWLPGLAFGVGYMFLLQSWMVAVGPDAWIGISLLEAAFFGLLGALLVAVPQARHTAWPLWWSAIWVVVEQVRTHWPFGGMPWGRLSYAVLDTPTAGWLPWIGMTGVSWLLAWAAASLTQLLAEAFARTSRGGEASVGEPPLRLARARAALTGTAVLLPLVPGLWGGPLDSPAPDPADAADGRIVTVAAVQGEVPGDGTDVLLDPRGITRNVAVATERLASERWASGARPDLVIWPENSTAVDPFENLDVRGWIEDAVAAVGVPVVIGVMANGPRHDQVLNQGIVWTPEAGPGERYTKLHPVPFGEYIPYRSSLPFVANFGNLRLIGRDMMRGREVRPLHVDTVEGAVRIANSLCFDVAYDDGIYTQIRQGAELLVVQTSNAKFVHTSQIEQQFAISRLRAIEARKPLVVASMNGVTGLIAADGSITQRAPVLRSGFLVGDVRLSGGATPAMWMGPALGWLALGLAGWAWVFAALTYRRGRRLVAVEMTGQSSTRQVSAR
ncbi:MAG: apolipoprotein N-acyltransferase [Nocardioides sp.]